MYAIYNTLLSFCQKAIDLAALIKIGKQRSKFWQFVQGHSNLLYKIENEFSLNDLPVIWFHASSLGEFAAIRPIIKRLKSTRECCVVTTFFSPSGIEALKQSHPDIDYVFYLPLDTQKNVYSFLSILKPKCAVFSISEYWFNYLDALTKLDIKIYLISAYIPKNSIFFKWYGKMYRKILFSYNHIFASDKDSYCNLKGLGILSSSICGDPLFDNAYMISRQKWRNHIIDKFTKGEKVFIAGSINDEKDLQLVSRLANKHKDTKFIFVPHAISEEILNRTIASIQGKSKLYCECNDETDFTETQVLIIDFIGALAYIYRYGTWVYIGGGFTPLLHSVIEPLVYGLPIAFGPQIHRKPTPNILIHLGIGQIVKSFNELDEWFSLLKNNSIELSRIKQAAINYVAENVGATESIVSKIENEIWSEK